MRAPRSLGRWLAMVAIGYGAISLMLAGLAGWFHWEQQKARAGLSHLATSRAILGAVERELDRAVALARGLSVARSLTEGDLARFDRQAREAVQPYGYALTLIDPHGLRQMVNTELPLGIPSDLPIEPGWLAPETIAGAITVRPLSVSLVTGAWITIVQVPVLRDGKVVYIIDILIPARAFQQIVDEQRLPDGWNAVVLDSEWTVMARSLSPERFVGKTGASQYLQHVPEPDSIYELHTLEGDWSLSARSRSQAYGWSAAVSEPEAGLFRQVLGSVASTMLLTLAIAFLAIGGGALFAARLARSIGDLALSADALGKEQPVPVPRLFVRELATVGEAMQRAAGKLRDNARLLEQRVAEKTAELGREAEERRKAETALAHAQRLESLGQLTGGLAHDFNNLLTVIAGNLEMIEAKAPGSEIARLAGAARRGSARGAQLVQSLLAFARKQPLHPVTVNPNSVIKDFGTMLRGAVGDAIQLQILLSPTVHPCRVDPTQLQSSLLNLATNARAAMPGGGRLTIETRNVDVDEPSNDASSDELAPGRYVRIDVSDTGTGMGQEVIERALEPFYTTKGVGQGTGLGLSQVYGFVKQSGGGVRISSEIGIGTTISLYLPPSIEPALAAHEPVLDAGPAPSPEHNGRPATVMVVDDDPDVRAVLVEHLRTIGYRVVEAADGPDALALLARCERLDVILTDYSMPNGLTGRDLGRRVAAIDPSIRLVLISGHVAAIEDADELAADILRKPISRAELARAIAVALRRKQRSRQTP